MKTIFLLLSFLIISINIILGQGVAENWDTYIASYENNKIGTTLLRMDLKEIAPLKDFSYVLVTGVTYEGDKNGMPDNQTLLTLYEIEEDVVKIIKSQFGGIYAGSFMCNNERLTYSYLKSNQGVKESLNKLYDTKYIKYKKYINLKEDPEWKYYSEFLYPNDNIINYNEDQKVVMSLEKNGDNLTKARRIDHWAYFDLEIDTRKFEVEIQKQGYKTEELSKDGKDTHSYKIQFWKEGFVDLKSINKVTVELRTMVKIYNGVYDGWETVVLKN